jgi:hypothetical protein
MRSRTVSSGSATWYGPVSPKVRTRDFAFAAGHCRIAISLLAGILNSGAAVSITARLRSIGLIACSVIHRTDAGS